MNSWATGRRRLAMALAASVLAGGILTAPTAASASGRQSDHPGTVATALVSPTAAQTMDGFGASGAWWPSDLEHFPPAVQERVADLLFSRTGIGLSSYRYNIGGGGVGVTDPTRAACDFSAWPGTTKCPS